MRTTTKPKIVGMMKEEFGDALRSVAIVDDDHDVLYIRDDVKELYSKADSDSIYQERRAQSLSSSYLEQTWNAGSHLCTMYWFDDMFSFHFMINGDEISISVESDEDINLQSLKTIIDTVVENSLAFGE